MSQPHAPLPAALGNPAWSDNWTCGAGTRHLEIMQPATGAVWLAQAPITDARAAALVLPDGFILSGIGDAVADFAFFPRAPGAMDDGPLPTLEIDGIRFAHVATPGMPEPGFTAALVLSVQKHHRVLYRAGRTLEMLRAEDGADYVPLVTNAGRVGRDPAKPRRPRVLPPGWTARAVTLRQDLLVELPCPTRAAFFFSSGDSFQGPLSLEV